MFGTLSYIDQLSS